MSPAERRTLWALAGVVVLLVGFSAAWRWVPEWRAAAAERAAAAAEAEAERTARAARVAAIHAETARAARARVATAEAHLPGAAGTPREAVLRDRIDQETARAAYAEARGRGEDPPRSERPRTGLVFVPPARGPRPAAAPPFRFVLDVPDGVQWAHLPPEGEADPDDLGTVALYDDRGAVAATVGMRAVPVAEGPPDTYGRRLIDAARPIVDGILAEHGGHGAAARGTPLIQVPVAFPDSMVNVRVPGAFWPGVYDADPGPGVAPMGWSLALHHPRGAPEGVALLATAPREAPESGDWADVDPVGGVPIHGPAARTLLSLKAPRGQFE